MAEKVKLRVVSDLVRWEVDHRYTREEHLLTNPDIAAVELTDAIGYPVIDNGGDITLAAAGDEAYVIGLLVPANSSVASIEPSYESDAKCAVLVRGPAIIDKSYIAAEDFNGDAFDVDAIAAALKLLGILPFVEPTKQSTQST